MLHLFWLAHSYISIHLEVTLFSILSKTTRSKAQNNTSKNAFGMHYQLTKFQKISYSHLKNIYI